METLLIFILMHLIGDFYLQTAVNSKCKNSKFNEEDGKCQKCKKCINNKLWFLVELAKHVGFYLIPFIFCVFFIKIQFAILFIFIVGITHYIIDLFSIILKKKFSHNTIFFIIDQMIHILVFVLLNYFYICKAKYLNDVPILQCIESIINLKIDELFIQRLVLFTLLLKPAGVFIDIVFSDINFEKKDDGDKQKCNTHNEKSDKSSISKKYKVGYIIGILERIIVCIFVVFSEYTVIGFIITIKTWARSRELKDKSEFREKYLTGTLLSILIAIIVGVLF